MSENTPIHAYLLTCDDEKLSLPTPYSFDILRTDGDGCDAFTLCTSFSIDASKLQKADRLLLRSGGDPVFSGLVDEIERSADASGTVLTVYGRGYGARLLDNQVKAAEFATLTTSELLRRYVEPYGITAAVRDSASVSGFSVHRGYTAMQVVEGFCVHAGLLPPHFDGSGKLLLLKNRTESELHLHESELLSAVYRDTRYGVRSYVELMHTKTGEKHAAKYPAFIARGGMSKRYGSYSGMTTAAADRTALQRVRASRREEYTLELTVPTLFPCEPGVRMTVKLPHLDVSGAFAVSSVRSVGSERGCYAVLQLRKE